MPFGMHTLKSLMDVSSAMNREREMDYGKLLVGMKLCAVTDADPVARVHKLCIS